MTTLQPLTMSMVRDYVVKEDFDFTYEDEGVTFSYEYEADSDCELEVWAAIEDGDTYLLAFSNRRKRFPSAERERLVWLCNTWNEESAYPMAYVSANEDDPEVVTLELSYAFFAKVGLTQGQLDDVTEEMVDAAFSFWSWVKAGGRE